MYALDKLMRVAMSALLVVGAPVFADGMPSGGGPRRPSDADLQQYGKNTCFEQLAKRCTAEGEKASGSLGSGLSALKDTTMNKQSGGMASATGAGAANFAAAGDGCAKIKDECKKTCDGDPKKDPKKGPEKVKECESKMDEIAATYQGRSTELGGAAVQSAGTQTATGATPDQTNKPQSSPGGGGGGGGGGGAMMGAMAGMAAGMMMAQMMNQDDKKDQQQQLGNGLFQADGSLNCSVPEAVNFSACNNYFAQSCTAAIAAGAYSTSAGCQAFAARYCSAPNASAAQVAAAAQSGMPVVGVTGEGLSANPAFCQKAVASNFCSTPGNAGCPSCQNLSAQLGSVCTANPALCLGQSSTTTLDAARRMCPSDPMFTAGYVGGAATVVTGGSGLPTAGPGGPVVGGAPLTGVPVVLPQSASLPSDIATREGLSRSAASVGGGGGGMGAQSLGGARLTDRVATGGPSAESVAAAVNAKSAVAYNASVASAGPAPDVQGQFGPSLFSTSSQAIRSRCESGRLNCR